MSSCARCSKVVYPMEELRCLDKLWHKSCFKCNECGVLLSLQNYKGFQKIPYCRVHVPIPKPTQVASTPEIKRATQTTKMQSIVEYHANYEKQVHQFTPVSDTPEARRAKEAAILASNVFYHGEMQKKAEMDMKRGLGEQEIMKESGSPGKEDVRHAPTVIYTSSTGALEPTATIDAHVGSIAEFDPLDKDGKNSSVSVDDEVDDVHVRFSAAKGHADGIDVKDSLVSERKELLVDANDNYETAPAPPAVSAATKIDQDAI